MKKVIRNCMICLALILGLAGCGKKDTAVSEPEQTSEAKSNSLLEDVASENEEGKQVVAISMPSQADDKWIHTAAVMNTALREAGCQVLVEFAEDNAKQQINQIQEFVEKEVDCLVVAPIPLADLTEALEKAAKKKIPIISYDRLIADTEAVDYYVGFDNLQAGRQIGEYIVEAEDLKKSGSSTIEFFMGDPQDYSAKMVHQGILEILQPYLDSGRLVCKSGRIKFADTAILYESQDTAQKNCEALLDANYLDGRLDILCASSDTLAYGLRTALENRGYSQGKDWPLVTGQDAQLDAVKNIKAGYQTMSVFRDFRILAEQCAKMAEDCIKGEKPELNEQKQYKNGTKTVPAYLCDTQEIDKENYEKILLDSHYYTKEQLP